MKTLYYLAHTNQSIVFLTKWDWCCCRQIESLLRHLKVNPMSLLFSLSTHKPVCYSHQSRSFVLVLGLQHCMSGLREASLLFWVEHLMCAVQCICIDLHHLVFSSATLLYPSEIKISTGFKTKICNKKNRQKYNKLVNLASVLILKHMDSLFVYLLLLQKSFTF